MSCQNAGFKHTTGGNCNDVINRRTMHLKVMSIKNLKYNLRAMLSLESSKKPGTESYPIHAIYGLHGHRYITHWWNSQISCYLYSKRDIMLSKNEIYKCPFAKMLLLYWCNMPDLVEISSMVLHELTIALISQECYEQNRKKTQERCSRSTNRPLRSPSHDEPYQGLMAYQFTISWIVQFALSCFEG